MPGLLQSNRVLIHSHIFLPCVSFHFLRFSPSHSATLAVCSLVGIESCKLLEQLYISGATQVPRYMHIVSRVHKAPMVLGKRKHNTWFGCRYSCYSAAGDRLWYGFFPAHAPQVARTGRQRLQANHRPIHQAGTFSTGLPCSLSQSCRTGAIISRSFDLFSVCRSWRRAVVCCKT